jgi:hypothetical protein
MTASKSDKAPVAATVAALPSKASPVRFSPKAAEPVSADFELSRFIPRKADDEPPVMSGIDLSGQTKIVFAAGRGKTGKTTLLRWLTERSLLGGASVMLADIDPTNASFSSYFEDVARPDTDVPAGVLRWLQDFLEHCVAQRQSAIIDLGGGDTTLRQLAGEMPGLAGQLEATGIAPVVFYLMGTQPDDLAPIATLADRGFTPRAQAFVLNEVAADPGVSRETAFGQIVGSGIFRRHITQAVPIFMPRLHAANAVESRRSSFKAAAEGATTPPLGFFDRARVKTWLDIMDRRFAGVTSWMP